MLIEIIPNQGASSDLTEAIMNKKKPRAKDKSSLKEGFSIEYMGATSQHGLSSGVLVEILEFTIQASASIASGILSNYLYEKLKNRAQKVWINSKEVPIDKDQIQKVFDEERGEK